ncbi:hypothetical protein [Christiangramia sp. SM2212]|uniref:Uncharacterized protein n=1 Tax=Christiangramia sediminicola TaxID=3073267 RepID=A0ABU1EU69_9FLAO|nr:hypothetical protein [Christiangramia sp. SM2212]MDR5591519.1 hypothetical protein [Christiangramia sp. SM2212]
MKNLLFGILACLCLISCSKENLYEFKDLTDTEDYIYMVSFYAADSTKGMSFTVKAEETNGYNEVTSYPYSIGTAGNEKIHSQEFAVKGYKKNGVQIIPESNIKGYMVNLYEIGDANIYNGLIFQHVSENSEPVFVGYNFETDERVIENREN